MADVATEVKDTKVAKVATPEKEVEKKVVEGSPLKEVKVAENGKKDEEKPKENGASGENGAASDESNEKENGDATETSESAPVKRKSEKGDTTDGVTAEGVSPEKKAKLDKESVENGAEEKAEAKA